MNANTIGAAASPFHDLGPVRLLIVDDDEVDRLAVRRLLGQVGLDVFVSEARSAEEALAMARVTPFECILLDYNLPGRDGLYALRALRGAVRAPVVMLTGQDDPAVAAQLIKHGAVEYLPKSGLTARMLGETVRHAVELHRARETEAQTRSALHVSEELVRGLMESSDDCVKVLSLDGRILTMSGGGLRLLELEDASELIGRPWLQLWQDEDTRVEVLKALDTARAGGSGRFEGRSPSRRGREIWWEVVVSPIRAADGSVQRLLAISRDTTDRRRREAFEQQLIGIVSHDLRNPINSILLASETLRRRGGLEANQLKLVDRVRSAAERAGRMVRDLLDFTQARLAGGLPIDPRESDLTQLVRAAAEELAPPDGSRAITIAAPDRLVGKWDPDRLSQVLSNLLSNALQYSPKDSAIEVTVREEGGGAVVEVRNAGEPIASDRLPHIFEPLERAGRVEAGARSIGLGLYIVKQVVDAHGGEVRVVSTGDGTTFTVSLPREVGGAPPAQKERPARIPILLVEDDDDIRQAERDVLESEGYPTFEARNGAEALRALERLPSPCIIILDLRMPVMDGLEFLRRLGASDARLRRDRVIVTSADLHARAEVEDLGIRTVLQKPFDLGTLFQLVRAQEAAGS